MGFIASFFAPFVGTMVKWASIVGAILLFIWYIRKGGADAAKVKEMMRGIEDIQIRDKIKRSVKRAPDAELDKWL